MDGIGKAHDHLDGMAMVAELGETDISAIPHLRDLFGHQVGPSDHTMCTALSVASVALGFSLRARVLL
jgi:sialic acid synthase SpsE